MTGPVLSPGLRELSQDDIEAVLELPRSVGKSDDAGNWRTIFGGGRVFGHADGDGRLLSCVAVFDYGALVAIGKMFVRPDWQRRGLGREAMTHVLARFDRPGTMVCLVASRAGTPLYRDLGFVPVERVLKLIADRPCTVGSLPASGRILPLAAEHADPVVALDAEVLGADRGRLMRLRLAAASSGALLTARDGQAKGYALLHDIGDQQVLGPLIAPTARDALALVDALLPSAARPVRVDLADCRAPLVKGLSERGFTVRDEPPLMTLRGQPLGGRRGWLFALASQAMG